MKNIISLAVLAGCMGAAWAGSNVEGGWEKQTIDSELPAISAVAMDVNGDGRLDVVAAGGPAGGGSKWSNLVYWYEAPRWEKRLVCRLREKAVILNLVAADLSGPAGAVEKSARPPDLVVDDGHFGEIWRFEYNRKSGEWSGSLVVTNVVGAHGTAAGDIDRDGFNDLLVPSQMGIPRAGILWARNPGIAGSTNGLWEKIPLAASFAIPGWQEYVKLADLNGDGRLDALHGSDAKAGWFGFWLQGENPREPWEVHPLAGAMAKGTNIEVADMNGDGKPDIVASEGHGQGIWWFPAPDYPARRLDDTLKSVHSLAVGDLNGDGRPDVAACGYGSKTVACFYNEGEGAFSRMVLDTNQCAYDVRAVDLEGDGDLDILLSGQNSGNLVVYRNQRIGAR